ncbi:hypothetical protein ABZT26_35185 [Streptomyces sp. NPDC005395]|uniref:hypothetical protein n=1 Tax=Streptomyces sp. NPDC005395 TaxID=3157042 RepID=UPI0033A4D18E
MTTAAFNPNTDWDTTDWLRETKAVRDSLRALGVVVPECLPGEAGDCGEAVWQHYASYCAILKARVELMLYANIGHQPGPPGTSITNLAVHYGENVFRQEFQANLKEWMN